ncbi:hypothetical protein [Pseudorhodobacter wandonensis]|jgi:hypothetical protein|uniref:hypothetical protein n=1 Tax=Pseudorhodobacter wandonensis TaxID=1120568 RepID=UPI00067C5193|nr:hypothetical protein [Pseudorhodobacter wandonensis]
MIKVVTIFLIVIVTLAMFGKLGWLGTLAPKGLRRAKPKLCKKCGRHIIGSKGCDCDRLPPKKG